jgi:hypothetical protein
MLTWLGAGPSRTHHDGCEGNGGRKFYDSDEVVHFSVRQFSPLVTIFAQYRMRDAAITFVETKAVSYAQTASATAAGMTARY